MRKSKLVTIGLLAISIASCHRHHKSRYAPVSSWDNASSAYVSTDGGYGYYQTQPGLPFWFWYMMLNNNGRYYYGSSVVYYSRPAGYGVYSHGYSRYSHPVASVGGRSYSFTHASSRGGFGGLGRAVGA